MYSNYQQKIISHFEDALSSNSVRHAYVISGEAGVGKKTVSQAVKLLFACKNHCACGECSGCKSERLGANPDILTAVNTGKMGYEIDRVRDIIKSVYEKPIVSTHKLIVLENAHLLGKSCQNALLKAIEEPPPYAVFVLLCDSVSDMLPTVMSRVMHMTLPAWREEELEKLAEAERFCYKYAMGNPGTLLSLLSDDTFRNLRKKVLDEFEKVLMSEPGIIYSVTKEWTSKERKNQLKDTINIITLFLRDVLFVKEKRTDLVINEDYIPTIEKICEKITLRSSLKMTEIIGSCPERMRFNENVTMVVQTLLTQIRSLV
ncbi:MAG: hypothetical protein E7394_04785 [Ruminococcaceae bacterium]|nr:hypothetical protein [Oscillospiraceae bacterium]